MKSETYKEINCKRKCRRKHNRKRNHNHNHNRIAGPSSHCSMKMMMMMIRTFALLKNQEARVFRGVLHPEVPRKVEVSRQAEDDAKTTVTTMMLLNLDGCGVPQSSQSSAKILNRPRVDIRGVEISPKAPNASLFRT